LRRRALHALSDPSQDVTFMDFRVGKTAFDRARHGLRYLAISAQ
jgi:hypothetical protein